MQVSYPSITPPDNEQELFGYHNSSFYQLHIRDFNKPN